MDFDSLPDEKPPGKPEAQVPKFDDMPDEKTQAASQVPKFDDIPDEKADNPGLLPKFDEMPAGQDYGSGKQQAIAGLEGAAQGLAGPVAPFIETHLMGVKPEDIAGRQAANPGTHGLAEAGAFAGSMMTGVGEAGLIAKAIPEFTQLGKLGSLALKGGLESIAMQSGDEATRKLIQPPDPNDSTAQMLARVGYAGLLGAITGGAFGILETEATKGLKYVKDQEWAKKGQSWLSGYGAAHAGKDTEAMGQFIEAGLENLDKKAFQRGIKDRQDIVKNTTKQIIDKSTDVALGVSGYALDGLSGAGTVYKLGQKYAEKIAEAILDKPVTWATKKAIAPFLNKVLTSNAAKAVPAAINYATHSQKGAQKIAMVLNSIFKAGGQQALETSVNQLDRERISDAIDNNHLDTQLQNQKQDNVNPQGFAEGGKVLAPEVSQEDHFATNFPQENMILQTARGRIYRHLKAAKPAKAINALAFDRNEPSDNQHRVYNQALDLAASPLSVLKHVKDGTLTKNHMEHMQAMWPELTTHLSKEMTKRITEAQLKGETPEYKVRKSLSLFLGTPLDSTMTPSGIMAAQATYIPKIGPPQAGGPPNSKKKGSPSKMNSKMPNMYKTPNEAAESDRSDRS